MRLLAVYAADTGTNARPARDGEPCVPNFSVCGRNMFVGLETDGLAHNAISVEVPDETVNRLFEEYAKRYPAMPRDLLEKYFFASAEAALKFKDGIRIKLLHMDNGVARFYSPESETTTEVELE